jgi:HlyD family secretion protein
MSKLVTIAVLVVALLGMGVGSLAWIKGQSGEGPDWKTVEVTEGAITEKALAIGQIEPRHTVHVKSKISGIVVKAHVEVGDAVQPGDPLFEIAPDPTPIELVEVERGVEAAQARFERAEREHERYQKLADQGVVARETLEARREEYRQARIALDKAKDNLQLIREGRIADRGAEMESILRANAAGIVLSRPVNPGDPVVPLTSYQAGTEMATIADMSDLIFKGTVDEIDVGKLRLDMPARLQVGALPDETVSGRLTRIAPQAIEQDGAKVFEVEIELEGATDITLRAGYSATVDLIIKEKTEIPVLPERLVSFDDEGKRSTVEVPPTTGESEPREVEVELGLSDGLNCEIVAGLEIGNQVVERPPREIGSAF